MRQDQRLQIHVLGDSRGGGKKDDGFEGSRRQRKTQCLVAGLYTVTILGLFLERAFKRVLGLDGLCRGMDQRYRQGGNYVQVALKRLSCFKHSVDQFDMQHGLSILPGLNTPNLIVLRSASLVYAVESDKMRCAFV